VGDPGLAEAGLGGEAVGDLVLLQLLEVEAVGDLVLLLQLLEVEGVEEGAAKDVRKTGGVL
jgi:hypothetical protein